MEEDIERIGPISRIDDCVDDFVTHTGKQQHITPKIIKQSSSKVQLEQKVGRVRRRSKQLNTDQQSTPTPDCHGAACKKSISKKNGRNLFPSSSAAKDKSQETINAADTCTGSAEDIDEADEGRSSRPGTQSHLTPIHRDSQVSGRKGVKHLRDPQETEATSLEKKLGAKRRRLYSQPVGVIEPDGSQQSGSHNGDNPSTALVTWAKPSDTASRVNESVYDQLLEHSALKSSRVGCGGRNSKKVPGGRKSAPPSVRSLAAAPPEPAAPRSSARPPRRRAAAVALSQLRHNAGDDDVATSQTSTAASEVNLQPGGSSPKSAGGRPNASGGRSKTAGGGPKAKATGGRSKTAGGGPKAKATEATEGSPQSAADASPQSDGPSEELERGSADVFYLPTVVRSDDDSDEDVFEDCAAADSAAGRKRALDAGGRDVSDATTRDSHDVAEHDSSEAASHDDQVYESASQSSPESSHQKQRRRPSQSRKSAADANVPASPCRPYKSVDTNRPSDRRSYQSVDTNRPSDGRSYQSSGRDMSSDPSSMDRRRATSKRHSGSERTTCYSRVTPVRTESPDRSLRRHSYLSGSGTMSDRHERSGPQGRHSSSSRVEPATETTSGAEVSPRTSEDRRLSPRSRARPFFSVEPEPETPRGTEISPSGAEASASASDSISRHVLVVEQDPCWYRLPRREIGPNVSSETSDTRRRQERSPSQPPRRRPGPWTYGRGGGSVPADRQPAGPAEWRHSKVPMTIGGAGGAATRPDSAAARPGSAAGPARNGTGQRTAVQTEKAPRLSGRQRDSQEAGRTAAERVWRGRPESPEQMRQEDAEPDAWPEPEPVEVSPVSEQSDDVVSEHSVPTDQGGRQPGMSDADAVSPGRPKSIPSGSRPIPPSPLTSDSVPSGPVRSSANSRHVLPGPQSVPSGPQTTPPLRPKSIQSGPRSTPSGPLTSPSGARSSGSCAVSSSPAPSSHHYHVPPGPQSVPGGLQPIAPGRQPFSSSPPPFPRSRQPFSAGPGAAAVSSIGSELTRLVLRWRQLARLEQQTFGLLHAAQRRQRELMDVQGRIRGARLQEGKRSRAGILAACDALERLAVWA